MWLAAVAAARRADSGTPSLGLAAPAADPCVLHGPRGLGEGVGETGRSREGAWGRGAVRDRGELRRGEGRALVRAFKTRSNSAASIVWEQMSTGMA